ncbi:MAG: hypothetical protein U0996_15505 [Planctomycetaceae bacterium]
MRKRIDMGTDIAAIGVWDPSRERHDLASAKYSDLQAGLEADANAGHLFFIRTSADGGYPADFYVDELPSAEVLALYDSPDRRFLIHSSSGRLIAGGLEDFISSSKLITSANDEFSLSPGSYAIQFCDICDDKLQALLREKLGDSDYQYYCDRAERLPWGCSVAVAVVATLVLLLMRFWFAAGLALSLGIVYSLYRRRKQSADLRFKDIADTVREIEEMFPPFLCILHRADRSEDVAGGWHELD